ncbi:MAG: UbiA-like protein EboC [Balneolaceae bacterium]
MTLLTPGLKAALELMRPANIVTALADILAGFFAAGGILLFVGGSIQTAPAGLIWLLASTAGLYGGGVVFNDVFDATLDADERPERAIPSGRISQSSAVILGVLLLGSGILFAFNVSVTSGYLAAAIATAALVYNAKAKHSAFWGPLFMGFCRGLNLLLGISILPAELAELWLLVFIPVTYIGAITLISQGEVKGGTRFSGYLSLAFIVLITVSLVLLSLDPSYQLYPSLPFTGLFGLMVIPAFLHAALSRRPHVIKKAVKRGVLSLIILNSALAAGFAGFSMGILVLTLLPLSFLLSRAFSVT